MTLDKRVIDVCLSFLLFSGFGSNSSSESSSSINLSSSSSTSDGFSVGSNLRALFQLEISVFLVTLEKFSMILRTMCSP